ncbi:MAG: bacillithiol biosynthesis deacetylase BshB1 [Bacteroidia bacterium]|nr:bacillithiol biosynthesis deacetylase BshB1 [Bacteroidia bacterium]MCZ2248297.1 bacillithiol biosynthesis deacetylase BshB1 [Bacteroidia bacterium]
MKLDILAFGVHPDDVDFSCAGTLLKHIELGKKVGIIDLTAGELGTRGSADLRLKEAAKAGEILGVAVRENLGFEDCFFQNDKKHILDIVKILRKYQPEIVLANAIRDRHPDHGRAAKLLSDACFYSGLKKIETALDGVKQDAWRPKAVYHYIQDRDIKPDFLVDITPYFDKKMEAVQAFSSQFFNEKTDKEMPESPIAFKGFIDIFKGRSGHYGREANFEKAEGFTVERIPGIKNLFDLI